MIIIRYPTMPADKAQLRPDVPGNYFSKRDLLFQVIDWKEFDMSLEKKDEDGEDGEGGGGDEEAADLSFATFDKDEKGKGQKKPYKKRQLLRKQVIRGYGITEEGHSICINIFDFQPYFYIKLPPLLCDPAKFDLFIQSLKSIVGEWNAEGLVSAEIVKRKQFYGFANNELFDYAKLTFHSSSAYNGYKMKLLKEKIYVNRLKEEVDLTKALCETKVKSILRFFHTQNLDPTGWMTIKYGKYSRNVGPPEDKYDVTGKHSRCQIEVNCKYNAVTKVEKNVIGKILVASFDLECVSDDGSFPKASKPLDPVIQIGTTVYIFGEKECKLSYVATLGACAPIEAENTIVESYTTEKELILGWAKFMARLDPDIVTGYNIWGFDWKYLWERAKMGNGGLIQPYEDKLFNILQRTSTEKKVELTEQKLSSSALGDNFLYYIDMEGVVQIDLLKVMQRDYKLDSYKLDNVAKHFLKQQKEDLPYKQLFLNYKRGDPKDIKEIAVYCIKDCDLVNRLIDDRQVLVSNIGMANVCVVPFSYLFLKGQGIKIFSLVAKITRDEGFVVKDLNEDDIDPNSYEGAIVFVPEPNIYFEPVVVMDYNSLYPSSMIAENISHDSIVGYKEYRIKKPEVKEGMGGKFISSANMARAMATPAAKKKAAKAGDNDVDPTSIQVKPMEYELIKDTIVKQYDGLADYNYIDIEYDVFEGVGDDKKKVGYKVCRFAEAKSGEKALLPRILRILLKARKDTRKKMEYQTMYFRDGTTKAGIVTTKEKKAVVAEIDPKADANDFVIFSEDRTSDEEYNVFNVLDGTYQVRRADIVRVEDTYNQGEIDVLEGLQLAYKVVCNSLYGQVGAATSPICYKELAACTTATGRRMVIHARDTTLATFVGAKLTYGDSVTGDTPVLLRNTESGEVYVKAISDLNKEWESYDAFKPWDETLREKEQGEYPMAEIWTANGWAKIHRVIRHKTMKKIYRVLTHTGCVDVTEDHSLLSPSLEQLKPKDVKVGTELRHGSPYRYHSQLFEDCAIEKQLFDLRHVSMVDVQREFMARRRLTFYVQLKRSESGDPNLIEMWSSPRLFYNDRETEIVDIQLLRETGEEEYVYDIETSDGTFQAGIGQMIVKNTDSIFVNFTDHIKQKYPGRVFTEVELLEESIKIGQEAAKNVNKPLKSPQNIEYEKTFWPFVIFSKKRYFGNKYEMSIKKYKETSMGIVLKRRDNAQILKTIYKGIIDILLNKRDFEGSKLFFRESVKNLLEGNVDISQLVISKTLKADYANPTQIAHKVLADRMGERDEGNKPQSNDRIPYCYIDPTNWKCSISTCKGSVNQKNCKCNTCMGMFCVQHLGLHKSICVPTCRFCRKKDKDLKAEMEEEREAASRGGGSRDRDRDIDDDDDDEDGQADNGLLRKCTTCTGYYCKPCFEKHKLRKDKYGIIHQDKCKKAIMPKMLQGDLIEHPQYIQEAKLKIDFMYYFEHQVMKPVFQIFELKMKDPMVIVGDLITAYNNRKSGARPISSFFNVVKKDAVPAPAPVTKGKAKVAMIEEPDDEVEQIEIIKKPVAKKPTATAKSSGSLLTGSFGPEGTTKSPVPTPPAEVPTATKQVSLDTGAIKVDEALKKEILQTISATMLKKTEIQVAADGAGDDDGEGGGEGGGDGGKEEEDVNLAFEIFSECEDMYRDINEID